MATRRELLAAGVLGGAVGIIGRGPPAATSAGGPDRQAGGPDRQAGADAVPAGDGSALQTFRSWFQQVRGMGQQLGPDVLLPVLVAHTQGVVDLGHRARGEDRTQALLLAARYAEYAGWMAQERGSDADAAWWTDRAVDYASVAGDREMSAYALVRRALIAMYQRDAARTVALAQAAQRADCRARIRGLAAQREAQGHGLAGDRNACLAALDRAGELLATDPVTSDELVIGSSHVADPVLAARGWSLFDLGSPQQAAETLRDVLHSIPTQARRARSRYGARLALALASCRRLDEAGAVADDVLDSYAQVQSATIAAELRALAKVLSRWHADPAARRASLRLTTALQSAPASADYLSPAPRVQ